MGSYCGSGVCSSALLVNRSRMLGDAGFASWVVTFVLVILGIRGILVVILVVAMVVGGGVWLGCWC